MRKNTGSILSQAIARCRMSCSRPGAASANLTHSQGSVSGGDFVRLWRKTGSSRAVFLSFVLTALVLSMTSCRRAVEKARSNIRIEQIEKFERHGLTGAGVTLRVMNNTGYKLVLESARMDLFYAGSRVGTILLREGVEVPRRTTCSVGTQWQVKISDPLALYVMTRKFRSNDLSQVAVSYAVEGRGGPAPVNISREMMPLSDFLNIFGLTLQDVKNYFKE